jgi:DNA-binding CsgD family transcriptional regulator
MSTPSAAPAREPLTPRQRDVLRLMATGLTYTAMGERLGITHNAVKSHALAVRRKLGASNRAAAVALAVREGLA